MLIGGGFGAGGRAFDLQALLLENLGNVGGDPARGFLFADTCLSRKRPKESLSKTLRSIIRDTTGLAQSGFSWNFLLPPARRAISL